MKKIARKKSVVGSALRFGAAVPLCLMMLGGLSADANAANTTPTDAVTIVAGTAGVWNDWTTNPAPWFVGNGGVGTGGAGAQGGSLTITGAPGSVLAPTADIIFGAAGLAQGGNGGAALATNGAGGNGGNTTWIHNGKVTLQGMSTATGWANAGAGTVASATFAGNNGGNGGNLDINFGNNRLTLVGLTGASATDALSLVAGSGALGGVSDTAALFAAGNGGNGGNINFTAGQLVSNIGNVGFTAGNGAGGRGGSASTAIGNIPFIGGAGGNGGNVAINLTGVNVRDDLNTGNGDFNLTAGLVTAAGGAGFAAGLTDLSGQAGSAAGKGGSLSAVVTGNITVDDSMTVAAGAGSAGGAGGAGHTLPTVAIDTAVGGAGGAGGVGGSTSLYSNSISVDNQLSFTAAAGGAGGAAGDYIKVGGSAATNSVGLAGLGGVGGDAGNLNVYNVGTIKAGDIAITAAQGATGGAGSIVSVVGANSTAGVINALAGSAAGKTGSITVTSNAIVVSDVFNVGGIGGIGGAGGNNLSTAVGTAADHVVGGAGAAGATGGAIAINANYITAGDMAVVATGGNGGAAGTNVNTTNNLGGAGGAGGAGSNVTFNGNTLYVAGTLSLSNAAGTDASNSAANVVPGTVALGGLGGAGGTITFNTNVSAQEVIGTRGASYYMRGFYLDALNPTVSFGEDGFSTAAASATYNIGALTINTTGGNAALNVNERGTTTFRQIEASNVNATVDNLSKLNVASYNFILSQDVKPNDVLLEVNNTNTTDNSTQAGINDNFVVRNAAGVSIVAPSRAKALHANSFNGTNNKITLIGSNIAGHGTANDLNIEAYSTRRVTSGIYSFLVGAEGLNGQNSALVAYLDAIPGFTAYAQAQAARLAFVNQGMDHIINSGMYDLQKATEADDMGLKFFMSGYGSTQSYDTGADKDMDVEGTGFLAGMGWGGDMMDGQRLLVGAFMEGGFGSYDTKHDFDTASYNSDGSLSYLGLGMMAKYAFPFGLYFDASARVGSAKMTFNSDELGTAGYDADLDETSATYFGAHIGAGYEWQIDEAQSVDFNTRLLWTSLSSDDATSNYGDEVDFQSTDSLRWRTGARYNYAFDMGENGVLKPFVGAAFEQEFDGDAKTKVDGRRTDDTPSLHGATGIGELGVSWQATKAFSLELAGQGYIGAREGGSGNLNFKWEF